MSDMVT